MSTKWLRTPALVVLLGGLASLASAQSKPEDSLLNRAKAEQALMLQRLEARMRDAQAEARRLQPTSKIRAANALKTAVNQLEDPLIPSGFRNEWTAKLNSQIVEIESGRKLPPPEEINPVRREIKEADLKRAKAVQEEYSDVKRAVDTIAALVKSGNTAQAQKEADALAKRYPDNPAVIALADAQGMNQRVADARFLVESAARRFLFDPYARRRTSSIMPKGDIEFDVERWREITKLRMKPTMTKKERELLKALDTPISLGYKEAPFDEVLKFISTNMGQNILVDKLALMQAMLESSTPVSVTLRDVATRTALRKVLQDQQLTYIIKDETIQVVSIEQARTMMVTRVYYLGDLAQGLGPFGGAIRWGPWMDMMQTQENVRQLVEVVKSIDPLSWKDNGGAGTLTFNWPSMSIIVRQTAEFHARLGTSLGAR